MFIPAIIGTCSVLLTYISKTRQNGWGLKAAFLVIFIFLALRYDYGNDYMAYLDGYNEITSNIQIFLTGMRWEPGWNLLHIIFKPFGFFAMVAFMSLATCVVFYRFIRNFVPVQYQWLAVFLYVFDPYQILVPASAMRQNLGIIVFLVALEYLYKKRIIIYLLLGLLAFSFHKSGIILLPLAVLPFVNIKINKFVASLLFMLFVFFFLFGSHIYSFITQITGGYFAQYAQSYVEATAARRAQLTTGFGFVYSLFLLASVLYYAGIEYVRSDESPEEGSMLFSEPQDAGWVPAEQSGIFPSVPARRLLFMLAFISFLFTPLAFQLAIIGRLNMYFTPILIAVYPIIAYTTRDKFFKLVFLSSLIAFTLFRFWAFFLSPVWQAKFGTYQTIFSAPQWY